MPSREIKTRFVLEGEQEYKRTMSDAANAIKTLNSEQKLAKAEFEATGDAQQYAADQARILKEQIEQQRRAVAAAEDAIKKLTENGVDKNSKQMQTWRTKLNNAKTSLTQMKTRLDKVEGELGEETTAFGKAETSATEYQSEIEKVNKGIDFQNTITAIDNITDHIEKVVKAAARAAKAVWDMGVDAGTWADNVATAAAQMGVDPETYQSWQYASRFIDTSVEDIQKSWQDIQKNLDETNLDFMGNLAKMGIASRTTAGTMRQSSDIFWDAIDYLHGIDDSSLQAQKATELFRNDWRRLMPLIQAGSGAYKQLAEDGRSVAVVSNDNVAALGGVDDAMQDFQSRLDKLKFDTLAALAPTFEQTAKALSQAVTAMDEFVQSEEGQAALTSLSEALTGIIDSFLGTDNGKGSFESIVNTAKEAVTGFTDAMDWISKNGEVIKGLILGMGTAWAGLKATKEILMFMQLLKATPLSKLSALFGGKAAAEGAGAASGAASVPVSPGKPTPAVTPTSAGLPALLGSGAALVGAEAVFLESSKRMMEDNKAMKDAVVEANQEVADTAKNTHAELEQNLGKETADLRDQLVQTATDALKLVEDRGSQAAPGIGMYVPNVGVNRSALMNTAEELKESADQLEGLLSESTMDRLRKANVRGGFLGIGSMGDQQLWDLVNDVSTELAAQTGEAQAAAEKITFTFASAPEKVAESAATAIDGIDKAAVNLTDKEQEQMDKAQKYWDEVRKNMMSNESFVAFDQFEFAYAGQEEKFEHINDLITELIDNAGASWTEIEDLPAEWFVSGEEAISALTDAVDEGGSELSKAASGVAADAVTSADNGMSGMRTVGQAAASGMAQGMYDRAGEVAAAARFVAGRATNMVSTILQIHSPSKVFERLGEYTAQGYADGINAQASAVQRAVSHMAAVTTMPVAAMAGVSAAQGAARGGAGGNPSGADASMINATVVMDKVVVGHMLAPVINDTIGAVVSAERD